MKLLSASAILAVSTFAGDVTVIDEIVAKVNGDIVTRGELLRTRKLMEASMRQEGLSGARLTQALQDAEKNMLRDRIDTLLLISKGKELNISIDNEVTKYLADIQRRYKIADPEKFQQFIREQTGMPFEDYRNDIKNGMLTQRVVRQEVSGRINIRKEEQQKYYEEHKEEFQREERIYLRNILVSTEGKDAAGVVLAEKKAKDLVARARKGEKFAEMAQVNSDDAATADQGGDLGQFWKKGELKKELEDLVWNQPRGYVTDPYKIENGFYILKVEEHQQAGLATFEEVENEIMEKLFRPRMDPEVRKYLTKLRTEAFLEIKGGFEDSGAAPGKNTAWSDPAQIKPETVTKAEVAQIARRKRLLWMMPVPGTSTAKVGTSSSR